MIGGIDRINQQVQISLLKEMLEFEKELTADFIKKSLESPELNSIYKGDLINIKA
ncbi:MAG: hypothetical protein ABGX12_03635 [Desulfurobacteriaceae bacterium]